MQGGQGKALRIMSIANGWDPNVIQGTGEDIGNFNKSPDGVDHKTVGTLPQGTPESFPGDHPNIGAERIPFSTPDRGPGWDSKSRATKGNDPFSGMGGM